MPDGNPIPTPLITHHELAAHRAISEARRDFRDWVIGVKEYQLRVQFACEQFAPRCPCGLVLSRKPEIGRVVWSCSCGFRTLECR